MNSDFKAMSDLSSDDKLLIRKIIDYIRISENNYMIKFSFFLDERQTEIIKRYLTSIKYETYNFSGGYEKAKRQVLMIFSDYYENDSLKFPIKAVEFTYRKQDKLSHRDFLGLLMSFQIKRDLIGDIIVSDGKTIVFLYDTIADFVVENTNKVGNIGVQTCIASDLSLIIEDKFESLNGSVASLRLDCVASLATGLSRAKTTLVIKSLGIDINYINIKDTSYNLKVGDTFSIRGYGKFILESENGVSKKGKKYITIKKFI